MLPVARSVMVKPEFFLEPEPSFLALIIFFGAGAEFFGSDFFGGSQSQSILVLIIFFGARAEIFGSDYFLLEPEPSFLALNFYFGACHGA